ncbi:Nuclear elongation and deformation protein 1 [Cichlidogyrus casuarinus]|uniref:phosphatidate phosphatase n=1 Tax=Cichlidogyrus casuarinus TaxID=1844966 RepID=A0ABD2QLN7_9PLAT
MKPVLFNGAIDVVIVEQPDGTYKSGPFHIRFGKTATLFPHGQIVDITLNGFPVPNLHMRLGRAGDGFFINSPDTSYESDAESVSSDSNPSTPITRARSVEELSTSIFSRPDGTPDFPLSTSEGDTKSHKPISVGASIECLSDGEFSSDRPHRELIWEWGNFPKKSLEVEPSSSKNTARTTRYSESAVDTPIPEDGVYLDDIAKADQATKNSTAIDAGYKSDGEPPCEYQENPLDVKLSLCGKLEDSCKLTREEFYEKVVTWQEFKQDPIKIITNPNLVILYKSKYFNWTSELPSHIIKRLEDNHMPKRKPPRKTWFWQYSQQVENTPEVKISDASSNPDKLDAWKPKKRNRLTDEEIARLDLQPGKNHMDFHIISHVSVFLWHWTDKIVVSDVDGTITKSDIMGHVCPMIGIDWAHAGIAKLYSRIADSGYKFIYLSSRPITQHKSTRTYVQGVVQNDKYRLPEGPILVSPNSLINALHIEVVEKRPESFKIPCLQDLGSLFPEDCRPLAGGFGNKNNDVKAYLEAGIDSTRIFTINTNGDVRNEFLKQISTTYDELFWLADHYFPVIKNRTENNALPESFSHMRHASSGSSLSDSSLVDHKDYTSFSYWRNQNLLAVPPAKDSVSDVAEAP